MDLPRAARGAASSTLAGIEDAGTSCSPGSSAAGAGAERLAGVEAMPTYCSVSVISAEGATAARDAIQAPTRIRVISGRIIDSARGEPLVASSARIHTEQRIASSLEPREPTEQIPDEERAGHGDDRTRAYRGARGFRELRLKLLRLLGNARSPFRGGRGCTGRAVDRAMRRSTGTVYLGGGLVRNLVRCLVSCLRRTFDPRTYRIRIRRIAASRIGTGAGGETAAHRSRVIHDISFEVRERKVLGGTGRVCGATIDRRTKRRHQTPSDLAVGRFEREVARAGTVPGRTGGSAAVTFRGYGPNGLSDKLRETASRPATPIEPRHSVNSFVFRTQMDTKAVNGCSTLLSRDSRS